MSTESLAGGESFGWWFGVNSRNGVTTTQSNTCPTRALTMMKAVYLILSTSNINSLSAVFSIE